MSQNRWFWILGSVFMLLFIVGVVTVIVLANRPFAEYNIVSPTALPQFDPFIATQTARPSPTLNPTTAMTVLPPPSATSRSVQCGWAWHTEVNPELSAEIQRRLDEQLPPAVTAEIRAESFGENCTNSDGTVRGFGVMQTDFRIRVFIENPPADDAVQIIAPVVRDILLVLADYPPDTNPGPVTGMIGIEIPGQDEVIRLWARYDFVMDVLEQGLTGQELLAALSMIEP